MSDLAHTRRLWQGAPMPPPREVPRPDQDADLDALEWGLRALLAVLIVGAGLLGWALT